MWYAHNCLSCSYVYQAIEQRIDFVRDHVYVITLLISVSLIGLMVIQLYLITIEIDLQRRHFDEKIEDVLEDMHDSIEDDEVLSNQFIQLFSQNVRPAAARDALQSKITHQVQALTDSILLAHNLATLAYDFAFYQRIEDTIVFSTYPKATQPLFQPYSARAGWRIKEAFGGELYRFGLLFHNKFWFLLYQVASVFVVSAVLVVLLLGSFFSTLLVLQRQKQLSALKNDFINNLTHELKTPIFASSIIYKIIREKLHHFTHQELDYHIALLEKENLQLKQKVEKVLELSVLERKDPVLHRQEIDIHEIIRQKTAIYQILISAEKGNITYELRAERSAIFGDPLHIGNIVDNLLDNAIKYCEFSPEIMIYTCNQDDALVLKISDNGMGIDSKDQAYIFDKFYRVSQGNLHQTKGFGLGLSYVKMMTEMHRGQISLESKIGKGSTFTLIFPLYHQNKLKQHASENITG